MKTKIKSWCRYGTCHYYNKKFFFCKLNAKSFFTQLENAIDNNLPISSNIDMPCDKFKIDHTEF